MSDHTRPSAARQALPPKTQHTLKTMRALYQLRVRQIKQYEHTHNGAQPWELVYDTVELGKKIRQIETGRV